MEGQRGKDAGNTFNKEQNMQMTRNQSHYNILLKEEDRMTKMSLHANLNGSIETSKGLHEIE